MKVKICEILTSLSSIFNLQVRVFKNTPSFGASNDRDLVSRCTVQSGLFLQDSFCKEFENQTKLSLVFYGGSLKNRYQMVKGN